MLHKALCKHTYAPELNALYFKGFRFKTPGALSVNEAIKLLGFKPATTYAKHVVIKTSYPAPYSMLDNVKSGTITDYKALNTFLKQWKEKHKGGKLYNGEPLPAATVKLVIRSTWI